VRDNASGSPAIDLNFIALPPDHEFPAIEKFLIQGNFDSVKHRPSGLIIDASRTIGYIPII
jgi:hypothetical protein